MHRSRPVILITGFGPFPGAPRNASSLLADAIADAAVGQLPGFAIHAETLPTEWQAGPTLLAGLLETLKPSLAVHFGVSRRARGFVVETRARNSTQQMLDARGAAPIATSVCEGGPSEMAVTLPTGLIVERLRKLGLPVQLSRDAGGYLCNTVLYHSLDDARHKAASGLGPRRGFIHIPDRLAPPGGGSAQGKLRAASASRLEWGDAVRGGLAILSVCAGVADRQG